MPNPCQFKSIPLLCIVAASIAACGGSDDEPPPIQTAANSIETVSNRADMVSGGDVLVRVHVDKNIDPATMVVAVNKTEVATPFRNEGSQRLLGLATGLQAGSNEISAWQRGPGGAEVAGTRTTLSVTNHPATGPVFSGPQEAPFFCQTHQFRLYPNGPFLSAAQLAAPCSVPTRIDYVYRNTAGTFAAFDPAAAVPADLATTTTIEGRTVPYIVRIETGTLNRAIYQTAILHNPVGDADSNYAGWNRRLVYTFGGGCSGGMYRQGSSHGGVLDHEILSRGFATASGSLNVYSNNCNDVLSAETAMMVKERFIEAYGPVRHTIGWGSSGGAVQQITMADNYPGILDGIIPRQSFPDLMQTAVIDARLFLNFFRNSADSTWSEETLRLASGFGSFGQFSNQGEGNGARFEPIQNRPGWPNAAWNAIVPADVRYDPVTNPTGARPTFYDHNVNTYGRDANGFARRPLDNVGIQYGLLALKSGQITKTQFLDLNEKVGGFDINYNFIPTRTVADPAALRAAYETGRILSGGGGLAVTAVLDVDASHGDFRVNGDVHSNFHHFSVRERVRQATGSADNVVMWSGAFGTSAAAVTQSLIAMDTWLERIAADSSSLPKKDKIVRNKPVGLTDGCYSDGAFIAETQFYGTSGSSRCNTLYPSASFPLDMAGGPLANNIAKCQLRPIDLAEYGVTFSAQEQARLAAIFPGGVCDWTRPGVEQRPLLGTWIRYTGVGAYQLAD